MRSPFISAILLILFFSEGAHAEDGYRLWLRYDKVSDPRILQGYRNTISAYELNDPCPVLKAAREELLAGLKGLLDKEIVQAQTGSNPMPEGCIIVGTPVSSATIASLHLEKALSGVGPEGFIIVSVSKGVHGIAIAANTDIGVLYGVHFLRLLQTWQDIRQLDIVSLPADRYRLLDHWDNLNRTIGRGYAGISLWNWHTLPTYIDRPYTDYARGSHYGPAPWFDKAPREDWNSTYYHRADQAGLGFDRTATGSNALKQYAPELRKQWEDPKTCPETWLLWFHHVPWNYSMSSGRSLWDELCYKYNTGVDSVRWMQKVWTDMHNFIDEERWDQMRMLLSIQEKEAVWWRNACLQYFQTFSKMPIPAAYEQPDHNLDYYEGLKYPYASGNGR